jgi:hypothetical protein
MHTDVAATTRSVHNSYSFHENKPKTLVFYDSIASFQCFIIHISVKYVIISSISDSMLEFSPEKSFFFQFAWVYQLTMKPVIRSCAPCHLKKKIIYIVINSKSTVRIMI